MSNHDNDNFINERVLKLLSNGVVVVKKGHESIITQKASKISNLIITNNYGSSPQYHTGLAANIQPVRDARFQILEVGHGSVKIFMSKNDDKLNDEDLPHRVKTIKREVKVNRIERLRARYTRNKLQHIHIKSEIENMKIINFFARKILSDFNCFFESSDRMLKFNEDTNSWIANYKDKSPYGLSRIRG